MSLTSLLNQTVTILTLDPGAEDEMGNAELASTGSREVPGRIQQTVPTEVVVGRDTAVSEWVLYLGPDVQIGREDRVAEGGRTFEVVGTPYAVQTPSGPHHLQVRLRFVEG